MSEYNNKRSNRASHSNSHTASEKVKSKNTKNKKGKKVSKHPKFKKVMKICIIALVALIIIAIGVIAGAFFGLFGDDFKISKDDLTLNNVNATVYDKDGNLIAELSKDEKRKVISMDEMNKYLPKAFVAIEDERFYEHHGVDLKRTSAATVNYIFKGGSSSFGGSTITQQLVKNLTQDKDRSGIAGILRKVKEMSKAYQVEQMLTKEQILELYLNLIGLGGQAYGVETASQLYFSKSANELSLAECAYLAGINNSPSLYKPFSDNQDQKDKIIKRTQTVLTKMHELGYIDSDEEYNNAMKEVENGLAFKKGNINSNSGHSYHTIAALQQAKQDLMEKNGWSAEMAEIQLYTKGYKIYTTQDSAVQSVMEEEFKKDKYIVKSKKSKDEDTGEYKHSQAAMVIIDHTTGKVVGTVGGLGDDAFTYGLNRATQSKRQTGSSMKPLAVIAPAIEEKIITAATVYDDCETSFGNYKPKNYYSGYKGLSTVRDAIEISQNIIPLKIMAELTPQKSIEYLKKMGISSMVTSQDNKSANDENLSMALGGLTNGVSPLEMAAAYATIANGGEYIEPIFYTKVEDKSGNTVIEKEQKKERVLSEQAAYVTKSILNQPVTGSKGTATYCAISGMDVCAKTGTTNDDYDRWLCEFTPYYTAATWYGYDDQEEVHFSGNPAGKISAAVFKEIHKGLESKSFKEPTGIVTATICKDTGLLPSAGCSNTVTDIFIKGTVPTDTCTAGTAIEICKETNMIATEFCPEKEQRRFGGIPEKESKYNGKLWNSNLSGSASAPKETCNVHTSPAISETNTTVETPQNKGIEVPSVIGETLSSAKSKLEGLKLKVEIKYDSDSSKEDGVVLKQSIKSGTTVDEGSKIIITVNKKDNTTGGNTTNNTDTGNTTVDEPEN